MIIDKRKYVRQFQDLMTKDYTATKIKLSFPIHTYENGYDPYENNATLVNLNPKTIKGYIHHLTPEQKIYKQYGLSNVGMIEIIVEDKYYNWFKIANKIEIEEVEYKTMRVGNAAGTHSNPKGTIVAKRAFRMVRLALVRAD
jgi:hypothetical protein